MPHVSENLKATALNNKKRCFQFARAQESTGRLDTQAFMQNSEWQNCLKKGTTL